jgi:hypothetical protein
VNNSKKSKYSQVSEPGEELKIEEEENEGGKTNYNNVSFQLRRSKFLK